MTTPNFESRYQLLKCVAVADGIRTHNALETVTGRVVMVHLADAAGPEAVTALRGMLGRLSMSDKARILETATVSSGFAIVTEFLQGLTSFPEWLDQRALPEVSRADWSDVEGFSVEALRQPPPAPTYPPPVPPPAAATPPAFVPPPPPPAPSQSPAPPPAPPPAAEARPPGEFTKLFGVMSAPEGSDFAAPPPPPAVRPAEPPPAPVIPPPPPPSSPMLGDLRLSATGNAPLASRATPGAAPTVPEFPVQSAPPSPAPPAPAPLHRRRLQPRRPHPRRLRR